MRYYLLLLLSLLSPCGFAQQSIVYITPDQLIENIKSNTTKATVIQFWIPNCANAKEIVAHYNKLENQYTNVVDFYFIGITNKESLVSTLIESTNFSHKIYIADPLVNEELPARRETFAARVCQLLQLKKSDFLTMYIDKKGKVTYYGDAIDVEPEKLKKVL
ncbi:thioredoxin domain-containing protein [Flavobacterium sp. DG1-102-2]|uniref:thioredoxin domain-containing protein n=1 Tax=Flavobacterium sp. DG1-102-2 TaxID=3081663 RepID=UPI002948CE56|nr:thioredoxin domain-containing protein [Flavobacterium sp. DG1-102-2]MDV6169802.1 thioredoxin domain-containing protein [Flavobacterium sp. DG1-102-2]